MDATTLYPELLSPYDPRHTPLPPPTTDICAGPVVNICMNAEWWSHISGMIDRLTYRDAWAGTDEEISDAIESIYKVLNVGRPTMSCGCGCGGDGLLHRYNSGGVYQTSYDNGLTWVDTPELDPRNNVVQLPPPTIAPGDDGKCIAANSGVAWFKKEQRDNYALLQTVAGLSDIQAAIIAFIVALGLVATGGALAVLLGGIAAFLISVSASEFNEAFTDAVWDNFLCALYCNMGADLSFSEAQFQAVKSKMLTESNLIARTWFDKFLYVIGAKGLTNAVRLGALGTMSCGSCECPQEGVFVWDELAGSRTQLLPDGTGLYTAPSGTAPSAGLYICTVTFFGTGLTLPSPATPCYRVIDATNPTGHDPLYYRCGDYALDPLDNCKVQYTWSSATSPFTITFRIETDPCG